ncbi:Metaxin [Trypanosoma melophagium]|uniref:Metaxin n=1 Tax=Trypanosoma melophagium TaxID=715481 RepID=UPI003519F6EC|nr:Metaxin [Trypanosoma melophagium]
METTLAELCRRPLPLIATLTAAVVCLSLTVIHRTTRRITALESGVVHLFIPPRWSRGPNYFSRCVALETLLRLARQPYIVHFVTDTTHRTVVATTAKTAVDKPAKTMIITLSMRSLPFTVCNGFLSNKPPTELANNVDGDLSPEGHAIGLAAARLTETSLAYGLHRSLLIDRPAAMADVFAREYNLDMNKASDVVARTRRGLIAALDAVGYGSIPDEWYPQEFLHGVRSLEVLIGNKPFLLGDTPTSYDCTIYGWLQVATQLGAHDPATQYLVESEILQGYVTRMTNLAFPDIAELPRSGESHKFIP